MPYVSSSAINRIEYEPASADLQIWFNESGGPYTYIGVPESVYRAFLAASSKGTFFNEYIRDRYSARGGAPVFRGFATRAKKKVSFGWR